MVEHELDPNAQPFPSQEGMVPDQKAPKRLIAQKYLETHFKTSPHKQKTNTKEGDQPRFKRYARRTR